MKPHEETLSVEVFSHAVDAPMCLVSKSDSRLVACFRGGATKEWEDLLSAAPEMARALAAFVEIVSSDPSFHDPSGEPDSYAVLIHAQQALKKAGVL